MRNDSIAAGIPDMILVNMPEPLKIRLSYHGPSADDGTMAVADVVSALQGFSGAYGKIAARLTPDAEHRLRVSAVEQSSFEVLLLSMAFFGTQPDQQQLLEIAVNAGKKVVSAIVDLIGAKKHVKNKPYTVHVEGNNNNVVIINADNAKFQIPPELVDIFRDKTIDSDLGRISMPIRKNEINSAKITADDVQGSITAEIGESEKVFFESVTTETVAKSTGSQLEGFLISLNKERNKGTFRLQDGTTVPYDYKGNDPYSFHNDFAHHGAVRITCDADFDQNLKPSHISITAIEHLQRNLPFPNDGKQPPPSAL